MNIFINQSLPGGHFKRRVSPDPRVATEEKKEPINDRSIVHPFFKINFWKHFPQMFTLSFKHFLIQAN